MPHIPSKPPSNKANKIVPKKSLGQNFLIDQSVVDNMIMLCQLKPDDILVEIGPGQGALTTALVAQLNLSNNVTDSNKKSGALHLIEYDQRLLSALEKDFPNTHLHACDVLKFDFAQISAPFKIVGNLPYNISTPLLFYLTEFMHNITDMCFMLQKEVVDRICATPNQKSYGRLSVMMQYYYETQSYLTIPPEAFLPAPKVFSSLVKLIPKKNLPLNTAQTIQLEKIVKQAFSFRRKTLRNALKNLITPAILEQVGLLPTARPENISVEQYIALAQITSPAEN